VCACNRTLRPPQHARLPLGLRALATHTEPSSLDADAAGTLTAAPPPPLRTAGAPSAEEAALPPVDWNATGGEATSAAGRVRSARQAEHAHQR
jgi:hypothetical protein